MSEAPGAIRVDTYVDPGCPWTWIISRWLVEVASQRDVDLTGRVVLNRDPR